MVIDNLAGHVKQLYDNFTLQALSAGGEGSIKQPNQSKYAQAACMYNGPAYQGLNMKGLNKVPAWAESCQTHLRVLSGLYGSVRPCDSIQEYRLCMGTKLAVTDADGTRHDKLYDFWGDAIASSIVADLTEQLQLGGLPHTQTQTPPGAAYLVNCASQEYFQAVHPHLPEYVEVVSSGSVKSSSKKVKGKKVTDAGGGGSVPLVVIECVFLDQGMIKSTFAKRARGLMAKFLSLHYRPGVDVAALLRQFNLEGYVFSTSKSSDMKLVFDRKSPTKPANEDTISIENPPVLHDYNGAILVTTADTDRVPVVKETKKRKR